MKRIGIISTILALMLVLIGSASATITDITLTPLTATEDTAYTGSATATSDKTITKYEITTGPAWLTINEASGALSGTPLVAHIGNNAVTVKATDADGSMTKSFTIAVAATNDAPVLTITDCTSKHYGIEDVAYTCTVTATDEDDTALTFSLTEKPSDMAISSTGVITWTPDEEDIGSHTIKVKVADDQTPTPASDEETFTIFVRPESICEDYTSGSDIEINDWETTDEDLFPGDDLEIEVDVENDGDDEIEEIVVEAVLYDATDGEKIGVVNSEEFDLDEDDETTVELTMEVPKDINIDHKIILFISAYEDGNDDENCNWEYNDDLDFKRRVHDVVINEITLTPQSVKPGKTVEVNIDVENVGDRDEEGVYVKVKNKELSIEKKSEPFDLDSYEEGDDDQYTTTVTFTIPATAKPEEYDLEINVYNKNGKLFTSGSEFAKLTVEGTTTTTTTTGTATITVEGLSETLETGKPFSIPVKVTNTASTDKEYKIILTNIADWAESTSAIDAYLTPGQTSTYYLTLVPKTDATEGQHSATVNVKEGTTTITTKTLSFTIPEKTDSITGGTVLEVEDKGAFQNIFSGTTFWILGDLVLVIVAIFFLRMLFSKKETE